MPRPSIAPMPPVAFGAGMPWDVPVDDPVAMLAQVRSEVGHTFVVDSGPDRYLFTFAPVGITSFYALREEDASKGMADWRMLRRKVPDELFVGRRTLPHELFGREDVAAYLTNVERALDETIAELGRAGTADVFALTRRLGHRIGLASWGGPGATSGDRFERLVDAFDVVDASDSFVHPDAMAAVEASGKAAEREAIAIISAELGAALDELPGAEVDHPLFTRVATVWEGDSDHDRRAGVAQDIALIHIASMSNLFAALGWMLVDLMTHATEQGRVRAGDRTRAEQCALESTRLAQRSIMARYVLSPVQLDVGDHLHDVEPGVTIATLLPLTNAAAPGFESWDPDRWNRRRLADTAQLACVESVTAFGHGRHTCPAQPFSLAAMTEAATRLFGTYELEPAWTDAPRPVPAQIGGVARAAEPCPVRFRER